MNLQEIKDKPVYSLTVGELAEVIKEVSASKTEKKDLHSIVELADYLGCSPQTVYLNRRKGVFGDAIRQNGRILTIDAEACKDAFFSSGRRYSLGQTFNA